MMTTSPKPPHGKPRPTGGPLIWSTTAVDGSVVQLKETTFRWHILRDRKRLELEGEEVTLRRTVECASFTFRDKKLADGVWYARPWFLPRLQGIYWVVVIVDHSTDPGDVVTAWAMDKITLASTGGVLHDSSRPT